VLARPLLDEAVAAAQAGSYRELLLYERILRATTTPLSDTAWQALVEEAQQSTWIELFLWIVERDALRRALRGDTAGARRRYLELAARALEHGHRPFRRMAAEALGGDGG
jgi:hypothetical protein